MLNLIKELSGETLVKIGLGAMGLFFFFSEIAFKTSDAISGLAASIS